MLRIADILKGEMIAKPEGPFVTLEKAAAAYRQGKRVAMELDKRFYIMDQYTTFQGDFDFMMQARWIIVDEVRTHE